MITVASSYAQRDQEARQNQVSDRDLRTPSEDTPTFVQIGRGLQGVILERLAFDLVVKQELPQNAAMTCNLRREFALHQMVYTGVQTYGRRLEIDCRVTVPGAHTFLEAASSISKLHPLLSDGQQTDSVLMDRVLPLPKLIRQALLDEFHPRAYGNTHLGEKAAVIENTLSAVPDKHCLVRPHLGESSNKYTTGFSFRYFTIDLVDIQRLEVDVYELTFTLGKAYAIIHWGVHNSDDVEFVFGSSLVDKEEQDGSADGPYVQHRQFGL